VIGCAIALDPEHIPARVLRVSHRQIDEETGQPDLRTNIVAFRPQDSGNLFFKNAIVFAVAYLSDAHAPGSCEIEEQLQRGDTLAPAPLQINVLVRDRRENFAAALSAADQNVQAPLAAFRRQWPELHRHIAILVLAVSDRDENDI